jgi:hypothetical protein
MSRPIRMIRGPRRASAVVITSIRATLNLTMGLGVHFRSLETRRESLAGATPSAPKGSLFCSPSDHDMTDLE